MKRAMVLTIVLLLLMGANAFAAGDLTVTGNATVNGNLGVGTTTPVTKLDIEDYQFVKMGLAGLFLKNNAYKSCSVQYEDNNSYCNAYGEAKQNGGVVYTRAYVVCPSGNRDSGWIAGLSASVRPALIPTTDYIAEVSTKGLILKRKPLNGTAIIEAEANW